MSIEIEERSSDSPLIDRITRGQTLAAGSPIRPAEIHWHMVFVKPPERNGTRLLIVGPWTTSGLTSYAADAEILWIRFKLGTFMPHLPIRDFLDTETMLPGAASKSFWLKGSAWQFPTYDNVETFVNRLTRNEILVRDPMVSETLRAQPPDIPPRTLRHRFMRATGLTQNHIYQFERAQRAAKLLEQGVSILDTVDEAGYFDQPHLTRSLKRFIGYTPAQISHTG